MPSNVVAPTERPLLAHHVAKILNTPVRTVRFWAKNGKFEAFKKGPKIWLFRRTAIEDFRDRLPAQSTEARHA
jgi:hypothetical protein